MVGRFLGEGGRRLRVDALASQKIVAGNRELAEELADLVEVFSIPAGETLITQAAQQHGAGNDHAASRRERIHAARHEKLVQRLVH
jgi:hypothetical protein